MIRKKALFTFGFVMSLVAANNAQTIEMIKDGGIREANMEVGGKSLFTMAHEGEFARDRIWITDGTTTGTQALSDVFVNNNTYINYNGRIYFNGQLTAADNSCELWATDGTSDGTVRVKTITSTPGLNQWQISYVGVYNGLLYFRANDGIVGYELWVTDGTEEGTSLLKDLTPGSGGSSIANHQNSIVFNNKFYFVADVDGTGAELWVTDGTAAGTVLVKNINPTGGIHDGTYSLGFTLDINIHKLYEYNNRLFFLANDGVNGSELWSSDGTESGTQMVKNINPAGSSTPVKMKVHDGKLYFSATTEEAGRELWVTDGTEAGTILLRDINVGSSGASINNLTQFNNELFFTASRPAPGGLWKTDGTPEGTILFEDSVLNICVFSNELYMIRSAINGIPGYHHSLSKSNGTINNTVFIRSLNEGTSPNVASRFFMAEGKLFLLRPYDPLSTGQNFYAEIWYTDGTTSNTNILRYDNGEVVSARYFWAGDQFVYNDNLYFEVEFTEPTTTPNGLYKISGIPTSINESSKQDGLVVYPNPTRSFVNIQAETPIKTISLYNTMGTLVQTETRNSFSVEHLAIGVYVMQVETERGIKTMRLVKSN